MTDYQKQTAILVFAHSSEKEACKKQFVHSKKLFKKLNEKTLAKANKTGLDVILITEKQQTGNSFGERFTNAIKSVFNRGYNQIITIGNDSPNLKTKHLLKAFKNLQENKNTLGPSFDGGTYLIALKKEHFHYTEFKNLPWQSHKVFSSLKKYFAHQSITTNQLNYLVDIDSFNDISLLIKKVKTSINFLEDFLQKTYNKVIALFICNYTSYTYSYSFYNKGSPF